MRRRERFIGILLIVAMMLHLTCCSLGSMPSRTSSVESGTESSTEPGPGSETDLSSYSDGDTSSVTSVPDDTITGELIQIAEPYMEVLKEGNPEKTSVYFRENIANILPDYYECNDEIYYAVFSHLTYSYGFSFTTDHVDYSLDVVIKLPDFRKCVNEVLSDTDYTNEAAKKWVLALSSAEDENSQEVVVAYVDMFHNILREAARRINNGSFTDVITYNDTFKFHDNGIKDWILKYPPSTLKLMSKDNYLPKLSYVSPVVEVNIIRECGRVLVANGELDQQKLDSLIVRRMTQE